VWYRWNCWDFITKKLQVEEAEAKRILKPQQCRQDWDAMEPSLRAEWERVWKEKGFVEKVKKHKSKRADDDEAEDRAGKRHRAGDDDDDDD
jgi:hypothetical protein